ncbi:hypothetical protein MLPF_0186 [Mycobacterium lepromatosis]|nr:hypothetical protein MLPF_0186 [Mycobacterium lepromatosis]
MAGGKHLGSNPIQPARTPLQDRISYRNANQVVNRLVESSLTGLYFLACQHRKKTLQQICTKIQTIEARHDFKFLFGLLRERRLGTLPILRQASYPGATCMFAPDCGAIRPSERVSGGPTGSTILSTDTSSRWLPQGTKRQRLSASASAATSPPSTPCLVRFRCQKAIFGCFDYIGSPPRPRVSLKLR